MIYGNFHITGGFVLSAVLFWFFDVEGYFTASVAAAAVHELGHILALYLAGGKIRRIEAALWGLCIEYDDIDNSLLEALVILAGPLSNFILCAALNMIGSQPYLASVSAVLGLFNMLPLKEMDGGRLLSMTPCSKRFCNAVDTVITSMFAVACLWQLFSMKISTLLPLAAWLIFDRVLAKVRTNRYN